MYLYSAILPSATGRARHSGPNSLPPLTVPFVGTLGADTPAPVLSITSVSFRKSVSLLAVSAQPPVTFTAVQILFVGHSLQVIRADAPLCAAEVVEFHSFWRRAAPLIVCPLVSTKLTRTIPEVPVPPYDARRPEPAFSRCVHFVPESLSNGLHYLYIVPYLSPRYRSRRHGRACSLPCVPQAGLRGPGR